MSRDNTLFAVPAEVRFWRYVIKQPDGCWLFTKVWAGGYGYFKRSTWRPVRAHRFSWELHNGPIPKGLYILHKCDKPACVNPDHLYAGTQKDNMRDCKERRRAWYT